MSHLASIRLSVKSSHINTFTVLGISMWKIHSNVMIADVMDKGNGDFLYLSTADKHAL